MQQCLLCPCMCKHKYHLKEHIFTQHGSETKCPFCNHETSATDNNTMQTSLTEHMWQCHATALHEAITMTHNMDRSRYPGEYLSTLEHAITDMQESFENTKKKILGPTHRKDHRKSQIFILLFICKTCCIIGHPTTCPHASFKCSK